MLFRLSLSGFLFSLFMIPYSWAGESKSKPLLNSNKVVVSSLCEHSTLKRFTCDKEDRDCVFETKEIIFDFYKKHEVPKLTKLPKLKFPKTCYYASYLEEAVNVVFDISSKGDVINVRMINSSNSCFDKKARHYVRRLKFKSSQSGFSCMPYSVSFNRDALVDSSGNRY